MVTRRVRPWVSGTTLLVLSALVIACSSGAGAAPDAVGGGDSDLARTDVQRAAAEAAGALERAEAGAAADADLPMAELVDSTRRIVKTGELAVEVEDVTAALRVVRAVARELNGYVSGSEAGDAASGATLTLRVPAGRFDEALERLRALGTEVLLENTSEEDVTSALVDLEARIENLRASEVTYRALMERATRIDDILAIQARLDEVRGQIEQLEAQAQTLNRQADLSTLTVSLVPQAVPLEQSTQGWNPGDTVQQALAALLVVGQALLTAVIWIAVVLLPLGIVIGLATLIVLRVAQPLRRRVTEPRP